ncbi:MAG: hypothetical protein U9O87_06765 [Verrucomicrobiota bacterium]|nr:hypothetical protein [Verrucomicrobiota bacterium]
MNKMNLGLWIFTSLLLLSSLSQSKDKTISALKKAYKKLKKMLPLFLLMMAGFSFIVTYVPPELIQRSIGVDSGIKGVFTALGLGSIVIMPGFAAFPLCAALKGEGVPYYIIAAFSLSLMNIGIMSFPLEKKFLGSKIAFVRNFFAFFVCVVTVVIVKIIFGE